MTLEKEKRRRHSRKDERGHGKNRMRQDENVEQGRYFA